MRALVPILGLILLAACGAALATKDLISADIEVEAARTAGAEKSAPYEYFAAEAYLREARVKAGYSQYQAARDYAGKAEELAAKAKAKAQAASNRPAEDR